MFVQNSLGLGFSSLMIRMFLSFWFREDIFYMGILSPLSRRKRGSEHLSYTCCFYNCLYLKTIFMLRQIWGDVFWFPSLLNMCVMELLKISVILKIVFWNQYLLSPLGLFFLPPQIVIYLSMPNYFWLKATHYIKYRSIYWLY